MRTPTNQPADESPQTERAEPSGRRSNLGTALSWATSIMLHVFVILLAFLITWAVVQDQDDAARVITSSSETVFHESVQPLLRTSSRETTRPLTETTEEQEVDSEDLSELLFSTENLLAEAASLAESGDEISEEPMPEIEFGGIRAREARRIIFVVDASGSMIGAFPAVLDELRDSLNMLDPRQSYGVVLFQRSEWIMAPPTDRLQAAEPTTIDASLDWIRKNVLPSGRSNPSEALRRAFNLDPDVIFLVSTDITGSGEFEIDTDELLAEIDLLNPRNRNGQRPVRIRCLQLLDPDPLGTLKRIAEEHGGPGGYAFIDRSQIGLESSK